MLRSASTAVSASEELRTVPVRMARPAWTLTWAPVSARVVTQRSVSRQRSSSWASVGREELGWEPGPGRGVVGVERRRGLDWLRDFRRLGNVTEVSEVVPGTGGSLLSLENVVLMRGAGSGAPGWRVPESGRRYRYMKTVWNQGTEAAGESF